MSTISQYEIILGSTVSQYEIIIVSTIIQYEVIIVSSISQYEVIIVSTISQYVVIIVSTISQYKESINFILYNPRAWGLDHAFGTTRPKSSHTTYYFSGGPITSYSNYTSLHYITSQFYLF